MNGKVYMYLLWATMWLQISCSSPVNFSIPPVSDSYKQNITYNNKVDIVWIIDNSSSMLKHQQSLGEQIPDTIAKLNSLKLDYHMAVITTSMGGAHPDGGDFVGVPKFLTAKTPNLANELKARLVVGEAGSNNERGLESLEAVLNPSYLYARAPGFFREEALLVIIALTDEDDKSSVSNPSRHYQELLDSFKTPWIDGTRSWVFNFIGVLKHSMQCATFNDYSEPGLIYMSLADISAGVKESICNSNLTEAVANIRTRIYQILTDFKLSKAPVLETLSVRINGVSISRSNQNGWEYFPEGNFIRFYGTAVPAADAVVKIDFETQQSN